MKTAVPKVGTERGRMLHRWLDVFVGKPLVALAGAAHRTKRFFKPLPPPVQEVKRVGVLTLGAIGDLLLVTALLSGLRRALPEAEIEVITSRANAAAVPLLPEGITSASFSVTNIRGMVSHIRAARYDILIDTAQWARISALVSATSGAARTVGFSTPGQHRHYAYDHTVPHRNDRHEKDNFLALGRALFPSLLGEPEIRIPETPSNTSKTLPDSRVIFCHMWPAGLRSHLKEWPAEYWGELATSLAEAGYMVLFTGDPQDAPATEAFLKQHIPAAYLEKKLIRSIAGKTSLPDLAYSLRRADAVVSVNTGIMHLAAIAGAPTIALNGPTNPLRWGPSGSKTCALLPGKGRSAYLNLGFEYGDTTENVLRHLPVAAVRDALAGFGICVPNNNWQRPEAVVENPSPLPSSRSLKDKTRFYLKKSWKALPPAVREFPLKALCLLRMRHRQHVPATTGVPIYIIGNFQAGGGISRSAQLYAKQMRGQHRHCICVDTTREMLQTVKSPISDGSVRSLADVRDDAGSGTVIIHLNPPQFLWLFCQMPRKFFRNKHVVAYWAWELEDIPALWKFALRFVDAVEVPSTFTQVAVARNTDKPVAVCPHVVPTPSAVKQVFAHDGKLRCLFVFDMASLCSRKNPQAVIAAFLRAFTTEEAELTIKVSQADTNAAEWERLQALAAPHPHVHLIAGWMDDAALERLFLEHDVYLSLHRSEGYGLTIREAMLRNLYVVATGWSGNMDFMQGERVFAVPYTLIPANGTDGFFANVPNARWAEPDIQATADILFNLRRNILNFRNRVAHGAIR